MLKLWTSKFLTQTTRVEYFRPFLRKSQTSKKWSNFKFRIRTWIWRESLFDTYGPLQLIKDTLATNFRLRKILKIFKFRDEKLVSTFKIKKCISWLGNLWPLFNWRFHRCYLESAYVVISYQLITKYLSEILSNFFSNWQLSIFRSLYHFNQSESKKCVLIDSVGHFFTKFVHFIWKGFRNEFSLGSFGSFW